MKVQELMVTDVAICSAQSTLNDAVRLMWEHDCGFVPIVESPESRKLVGVITDRDACMAAYTRGSSLKELCVEDAMSRVVHTCKPGDSIARAEQLLAEAQVRRLAVVDEARNLLGVLSIADIARTAFLERTRSKPSVREAEVGALLATVCQRRQLGARAAN
jgi:CBS domain-containing protein